MARVKGVNLVSGTFTGTGQSAEVELFGKANILIDGGVATVAIERSFDDGTTWTAISRDSAGNPASYATGTLGFNGTIEEPQPGVLYRLNCTAYTSGTVTYRISQ